ncbi:MAG: retropepsin-like aspartic protease [Pseudomonadota bacterium]
MAKRNASLLPALRIGAACVVVALSAWLGFLLGRSSAAQPAPAVAAMGTATQQASIPDDEPPPSPTPQERAAALAADVRALSELTDSVAIAERREVILRELAFAFAGEDREAFAPVIELYNALLPRDGSALLLAADLHSQRGDWLAALEPLFEAAEFPESNEQLSTIAAMQARLLASLREEHADIGAWLDLAVLAETLSLRAPHDDRLRLLQAEAQIQLGDIEAARDTLAGTGTFGVSDDQIAALYERLAPTPAEPIRFRSEGGSLVASAAANRAGLELLVDTGATRTALSTQALLNAGATALDRTVRVQTAGGPITARLYRINELVVEEQRFDNYVVLGLDSAPSRWDGLLGMDLLRQLDVDLSALGDG